METLYNDDAPGREYRIAGCDACSERIERAVLAEKLGIAPQQVDLDDLLFLFNRAEKFTLSNEMTTRFFREVQDEILSEHPDFDEDERRAEFVARMYGPTLGARYRDYLKKRKATVKDNNEHSD
jgi:hypothetical protein